MEIPPELQIRPELQRFAFASEDLLGYGVSQKALSEEERDLLQYYLATIAEVFPVLSKPH